MKHLNKFKTFEEKYILDDILSINEEVSSIIDKVKEYARKGLLTATVITALLASPKVSAQDKETIKDITKTETTTSSYADNLTPQQIRDNQREMLKNKRAEEIRVKQEARDKRAAENEIRLAPIRVATQKRVDNWILSHPGKTEDDYWKLQKANQGGGFDTGGGDGGGSGLGRFLSPCKGGSCPGLNTKS
jgi:hypothetical protein